MTHDVFISYASEDRLYADAICRALEEGGLKCWYAPRNIPFGANYEEAIIDAISESHIFLLLLSAHSNRSPHVRREVQNACLEDSTTQILPVRMDAVQLSKALRYYLSSIHWFDASAPPFESHLPRLVSDARARLGRAGGPPPQSGAWGPAVEPPDAYPPAAEGPLRSLMSTTPAALRFTNRSARTVRVHWLDFKGERIFYNSLAPGQSYVQPTFLTHPWLVTDVSGNPIMLHVTEREEADLVIE